MLDDGFFPSPVGILSHFKVSEVVNENGAFSSLHTKASMFPCTCVHLEVSPCFSSRKDEKGAVRNCALQQTEGKS